MLDFHSYAISFSYQKFVQMLQSCAVRRCKKYVRLTTKSALVGVAGMPRTWWGRHGDDMTAIMTPGHCMKPTDCHHHHLLHACLFFPQKTRHPLEHYGRRSHFPLLGRLASLTVCETMGSSVALLALFKLFWYAVLCWILPFWKAVCGLVYIQCLNIVYWCFCCLAFCSDSVLVQI